MCSTGCCWQQHLRCKTNQTGPSRTFYWLVIPSQIDTSKLANKHTSKLALTSKISHTITQKKHWQRSCEEWGMFCQPCCCSNKLYVMPTWHIILPGIATKKLGHTQAGQWIWTLTPKPTKTKYLNLETWPLFCRSGGAVDRHHQMPP